MSSRQLRQAALAALRRRQHGHGHAVSVLVAGLVAGPVAGAARLQRWSRPAVRLAAGQRVLAAGGLQPLATVLVLCRTPVGRRLEGGPHTLPGDATGVTDRSGRAACKYGVQAVS